MARLELICVFFLCSFIVSGQYHEDVFPGETGSQLINKLRLEFRPSVVLDYGEAREVMYTEIYNINDSVECVYSGWKLPLSPNDPDPIGTLSRNGSNSGINCEHTFPQSKGAGSGNARSDMHHLYPTRAFVNSARLNFPFEEINDRQTLNWFIEDRVETNIPSTNRDLYSEQGFDSFEPREDHKGNVARAVFYFYSIYREVADSDFFGDMRTTLCKWHYEDAVDSLEWERNKQIARYQQDKRNPYILNCSLAARTYCPDIAENCESVSTVDVKGIIGRVYPNPAADVLFVEMESESTSVGVKIINALGQEIQPTITSSSLGKIAVRSVGLNPGQYQLMLFDRTDGRRLGLTTFMLK